MSDTYITPHELNTASSIIVLVLSFINFVAGIIGLILNIIIFTGRTLRHEPCSFYLLLATCFNLFIVLIVLPVRILSNGFSIDMSNNNSGICKIQTFAFYSIRAISCWLIGFACLDRFFHSSPNIRIQRLSSIKTARITIGTTVIVIFILYSHMLIYFDLRSTVNQYGIVLFVCYIEDDIYSVFIALWHMLFYSLLPSFFMILFGFLTVNNIRRYRLVVPMVSENNLIVRRRDIQLLRMLIAQILVIIIFTLPYSINRLYVSFTEHVPRDIYQVSQENLITQFINTISYFAHTTSFYLYILTSTVFRKELSKIIVWCTPHN